MNWQTNWLLLEWEDDLLKNPVAFNLLLDLSNDSASSIPVIPQSCIHRPRRPSLVALTFNSFGKVEDSEILTILKAIWGWESASASNIVLHAFNILLWPLGAVIGFLRTGNWKSND